MIPIFKIISDYFVKASKNYIEAYLAKSVDRADFAYRENQLKHRGVL